MRWRRRKDDEERPYADADDGTLEALAGVAWGYFEAMHNSVQVYERLNRWRDKELMADLEELFEELYPEKEHAEMSRLYLAVKREQEYRRRKGRK